MTLVLGEPGHASHAVRSVSFPGSGVDGPLPPSPGELLHPVVYACTAVMLLCLLASAATYVGPPKVSPLRPHVERSPGRCLTGPGGPGGRRWLRLGDGCPRPHVHPQAR